MTLNAKILTMQPQNFATLYNDKGSDADSDVQFWHPDGQGTFLPLGDVCESSPSNWIYGSNPPLGQVLVIGPSTNQAEVAHPNSFTLLWTDKGSGATLNGSIWQMNPPTGYVALGHCCTFSSSGTPVAPNVSDYYCILQALTTSGTAGPQIWNTEGTSPDTSVSIYQPSSPFPFVDTHTFWAVPNTLGPPSASIAVNVLLASAVTFVA
jgi:Vacuolar protein sorting-associated protein 62